MNPGSTTAFGTYNAPLGILISPVVRHQAGRPTGRYLLTRLRAGFFGIAVEPPNTYREDNRTIVDARIEKQWRLGSRRVAAAFVDAFNIFNSNSAQAQDGLTGQQRTIVDGVPVDYPQFLRPLSILPPRTFRVGATFSF